MIKKGDILKYIGGGTVQIMSDLEPNLDYRRFSYPYVCKAMWLEHPTLSPEYIKPNIIDDFYINFNDCGKIWELLDFKPVRKLKIIEL